MPELTQRLMDTSQALQKVLCSQPPVELNAPAARPASVLMPLWDKEDQVQVVFTKRTSHLPTHAGQISFPGGMAENYDPSRAATALRETHEEIGVLPEQVAVVARLDQVVTVTDFLVTPYLGLLDVRVHFQPNPVEVERLVVVPLAKVLDRGNYQPTEIMWQGMAFNQPALTHNGDVIWGATCRMLLNLLDTLGDSARVAAMAAG